MSPTSFENNNLLSNFKFYNNQIQANKKIEYNNKLLYNRNYIIIK